MARDGSSEMLKRGKWEAGREAQPPIPDSDQTGAARLYAFIPGVVEKPENCLLRAAFLPRSPVLAPSLADCARELVEPGLEH